MCKGLERRVSMLIPGTLRVTEIYNGGYREAAIRRWVLVVSMEICLFKCSLYQQCEEKPFGVY